MEAGKPPELVKPSRFTTWKFDEPSMRAGLWLVILFAGCRAPTTVLKPGTPPPTYGGATLSTANEHPIVPDISKLPVVDANVPRPSKTYRYRGIDEHAVQCLAVANASLGTMLDEENARTSVLGAVRRRGWVNAAGDDLLRETRRLAALEARNKAALDALERYWQLVETEGRRQLFTEGIAAFDTFRAEAEKLRKLGLPVPKDDDLLRQRASLLADLLRIDAALALINHDLASKLNLTLAEGERLWPTSTLTLVLETPDVEGVIRQALAQRPELLLIRTLHERLAPETLPGVRASLQSWSTLVGASPMQSLRLRQPPPGPSPQEMDEVASRRKQLAELLKVKETEAAAQIRTAFAQMTAAAERVSLLQTRVTSFEGKLAAAKAANQHADIPTIEADVFKAKADVLGAAVEWQQWRVKLKGALGQMPAECQTSETRNPLSPAGLIPVKIKSHVLRPGK